MDNGGFTFNEKPRTSLLKSDTNPDFFLFVQVFLSTIKHNAFNFIVLQIFLEQIFDILFMDIQRLSSLRFFPCSTLTGGFLKNKTTKAYFLSIPHDFILWQILRIILLGNAIGKLRFNLKYMKNPRRIIDSKCGNRFSDRLGIIQV